MAWFETWFDSPYYHLLYKHRDEQEAALLVENIAKQFLAEKYPHLLDAACGKGRHALKLAEAGYQVEAFDLSKNSIEEAQKLVSDNLSLIFSVHNILDTYKHKSFDIVSNLFTSFGYFETEIDDMRAMTSLKNALKPENGVIIQDFLNANLVKENDVWQEQIIENVQFKTLKEVENQKVIKHIKIIDGDNKYQFKESVSLFKLSDFECIYKAAGLKIVNIYGDYHFNSFNTESSPRLIIISTLK